MEIMMCKVRHPGVGQGVDVAVPFNLLIKG